MVGKEGHPTRLIVAYQTVRAGKKSLQSVYNQHRRYHKQQGDNKFPRNLFRRDIIYQNEEMDITRGPFDAAVGS